ncbi:hypothetical protein V6N13_139791 [Hibiscus sabdariffa]
MVNDGVIMAKEDELEDSIEDIEVKLVRQLVSKTIDLFGDGTTTLVVLVQENIKAMLRKYQLRQGPLINQQK